MVKYALWVFGEYFYVGGNRDGALPSCWTTSTLLNHK
jgi:hypothetical protein